MKQRIFDETGRSISEIGLGCWQFGGDWGNISDDQAFSILQAAVDHGTNFIDTADVYGMGRSEELIGRYLKTQSQPLFIATKLGRFPHPGGDENYTEQTIRAHTEASLKRLGVESLDLTQLHCIPIEKLREGEVFGWLRLLKEEGKIQNFGASVQSMEEALICLEQDDIASLQIIFNIFRQKPITTLFDIAKQKGVALVIRLPLASGLLSGKMTKETTFEPGDHRTYNRDGQAFNVGETFAGLPYELGVELADELKSLVPEGMTMAQMSLRWILDFDAVSVIIPGASRPEQAVANTSASDLPPLSAELHKKLYDFYQARVAENIRGPY
jgi:aryl-alcohol dehydrogenase-like predicted oxidoreductase